MYISSLYHSNFSICAAEASTCVYISMTQNNPRNTEKKKNKARDITLSDYKQQYIAIAIKTVWY